MYKFTNTGVILRADGANIPKDPANTDYAAYLAWVAAGGVTELADPPLPIEVVAVSPRQIRQALTRAGLRTGVEAAVAAGDQDTKDWYEFSTVFERHHSQVIAMGVGLGVSPAQLDGLWALAGSL